MNAANKVAKNTGILYIRMVLTMFITLFSTRYILIGLGASDYGIYTLVSGIVVMLSFLNSAMTASTQRYLSFAIGRGDKHLLKQVFNNSCFLHFVLSVILFIIIEVTGLLLFDGFLNIGIDRIKAAKLIYHFMAVNVSLTVIITPFSASLNAHENMIWVALINIIEAIFKLFAAFSLFLVKSDKLVTYGVVMMIISLLSFLIHIVYCYKKYEECRFNNFYLIDSKLLTELTSFAGWNLYGGICVLSRAQGLAVLLNIFLGTIVNAAYGIANQISGQLRFFSASMLSALNPQIMKSEGNNDSDRMLRLSMMASKFGFFLLSFITIPCVFEINILLKIWLKGVPENTVLFSKLILISSLINQLTVGLQSAVQAKGKIALYQITIGSILLLNVPLAYFLLKFDLPGYSVLVSFFLIEGVACCFRLFICKRTIGLSINQYFNRVILKLVIPLIINVSICTFIVYFDSPYRFIFTITFSSIGFLISIYLFGLCTDEKILFDKIFCQYFVRLKCSKFFRRLTLSNRGV